MNQKRKKQIWLFSFSYFVCGICILSFFISCSLFNEKETDDDSIYHPKYDKPIEEQTKDDESEQPQFETSLALVSLTSPIAPGNNATICVKGAPCEKYKISVYYSSGVSSAAGLEEKNADESGNISWTWKVASNVKEGKYKIQISGGGQQLEVPFVVTKDVTPELPDSPDITEGEGTEDTPDTPDVDHPAEKDPEESSDELDTEIVIAYITDPAKVNNTARLTIQGKSNTAYTIAVYYSTTKSKAKGLEEKISDENGLVTWEWLVGAKVKTGSYKIVISGGGEMIEGYLNVQ